MSREKLDELIKRWVSRKLLVFIITCFGLFSGFITSGDFVIIAVAYVGMQGFTDIAEKMKR